MTSTNPHPGTRMPMESIRMMQFIGNFVLGWGLLDGMEYDQQNRSRLNLSTIWMYGV